MADQDISAELREWADCCDESDEGSIRCLRVAADEIDRLRAALLEIENADPQQDALALRNYAYAVRVTTREK